MVYKYYRISIVINITYINRSSYNVVSRSSFQTTNYYFHATTTISTRRHDIIGVRKEKVILIALGIIIVARLGILFIYLVVASSRNYVSSIYSLPTLFRNTAFLGIKLVFCGLETVLGARKSFHFIIILSLSCLVFYGYYFIYISGIYNYSSL